VIPQVVASERGGGQTGGAQEAAAVALPGLWALSFPTLPGRAVVRKARASRAGLGRPTVDGESPVGESARSAAAGARVAAGP
jgi:hypothetical protein